MQNNQVRRLTKEPCHNNEARSEVREALHTQGKDNFVKASLENSYGAS